MGKKTKLNREIKTLNITDVTPCLVAIESLLGHTLQNMCAEYKKAEVGDWVMEYTNPFAPLIKKFGKVVDIYGNGEYETQYVIEQIDGNKTTWENCRLYVIPRMSGWKPNKK